MKKYLSLTVLTILIVIATLSVTICGDYIAFAGEEDLGSDFSLIYPVSDYIQLSSAKFAFPANDGYAVYDDELNRVFFSDGDSVSLTPHSPTSIAFYDGCIYFSEGKDIYSASKTDGSIELFSSFSSERVILSDHKKLYAADTISGDITIWDSELIIFYDGNFKELRNSRISVTDGFIYSYSFDVSSFTFKLYRLYADNLYYPGFNVPSFVFESSGSIDIAVSDYIYALDKANGNTVKVYTLDGGLIASCALNYRIASPISGDTKGFWAVDGSGSPARYFEFDGRGLNAVKTVAESSNDITHLKNPSDVLLFDGKYYIADKGNDRIIIYGDNNASAVSLPSPNSLTKFNGAVYAASRNKISRIENGKITAEFSLSTNEEILSLSSGETALYAMTESNIYSFNGFSLLPFAKTSEGKKIAASESGKILYLLDRFGLVAYSASGSLVSVPQLSELKNATDFEVDYVGNILASFPGGVIKYYERTLESFTEKRALSLSRKGISTGEISALFSSAGGDVYFLSSRSFLAKLDIDTGYITKAEFTPTQKPELSDNLNINPYKTKSTVFYEDRRNFESMSLVEGGSVVLVFEDKSEDPYFKYVLYERKLGYIPAKDLSALEEKTPNATTLRALHSTVKLYSYPADGATVLTLSQEETFTAIGDAGGFKNPGGWYRVRYNDSVYFVPLSTVTAQNNTELTNKEIKYGRAEGGRIGTKVNIYALPQSDSTIIDSITDGTEVTIISDNVNGYYQIRVGKITGFIKEENLKMGGLTNAQIAAIVASCITLAAGIFIFTITYKVKKYKELNG
ncbi:MAG: hypothetical protein GX891_00100 [Clostridiales bacterium]|nr:hypothetical protein [Clostridiales bacterium]